MQSNKSRRKWNFKIHIVTSDVSDNVKTKYQQRQKSISKIN